MKTRHANRPEVTAEHARAVLAYDESTGRLTWVASKSVRVKNGAEAGYVNARGYRAVSIAGRMVQAHRLIFLMQTGSWPAHQIDHINGNRADNRWSNLREATASQNHMNSGRSRNNTSGVRGVTWDADRGKWMARVYHQDKQIKVGRFERLEDAKAAVTAARARIYGDFAKVLA